MRAADTIGCPPTCGAIAGRARSSEWLAAGASRPDRLSIATSHSLWPISANRVCPRVPPLPVFFRLSVPAPAALRETTLSRVHPALIARDPRPDVPTEAFEMLRFATHV